MVGNLKHGVFSVVLAACAVGTAFLGQAEGEDVDLDAVFRIREEGFSRSQVMDLAWVMTDLYGPRYANSPSYVAASRWARSKLESFGLANCRLEPWGEFGYSWENSYTSVHITVPQYQPVIAYPIPGTRGTAGVVKGKVAAIDISEIFDEKDLEALRNAISTKILLVSPQRRLEPQFSPQAVRLSDEELGDMARLEIGRLGEGGTESNSTFTSKESPPGPLAWERIEDFLATHGVEVVVQVGTPNVGPMDKGVVHVEDEGTMPLDKPPGMPRIVVAAEHYNRIMRLLEHGYQVEMGIEVRNRLGSEHPLDSNILAEIPGSDRADEIVMIGAHFDSEPAGTGATDNAAGSAIAMEAMRILATVGVRPRRTIRLGLWGAEEEGLRGSRGYVRKHLGDPKTGTLTPEHEKFSVYFNVDWYGKFRGVYLQGNDAARPIFKAWMAPFEDVGMSWIVPGNTGGTDHMAFLEVGLPAFQFVQDDLEFFNVTFHTNMDVFDRLVADDLKQASVILASFAYQAAMRDEKFPRADGLTNGRRWHK